MFDHLSRFILFSFSSTVHVPAFVVFRTTFGLIACDVFLCNYLQSHELLIHSVLKPVQVLSVMWCIFSLKG